MDFPRVENAHVVSRCYLRNFAQGEYIGMCLVGSGKYRDVPLDVAGIRKRYYRRERRQGASPRQQGEGHDEVGTRG